MSIQPRELAYLRNLARRLAGVLIRDEQRGLVEMRLRTLANRSGFESSHALLNSLMRSRDEQMEHTLIEFVANQETWFFRERRLLETLTKAVLPELRQRRPAGRPVSIWFAACSTGQEPYTVAMMLREQFGDTAEQLVRLVASDFSHERIEYARRGRYTQMEVNRGLPARLLVKYFDQRDGFWQLDDSIRKLVSFQRINLVSDVSLPAPMDVILLCNVLYYLDPELRRDVLRKVHMSLKPDGYLLSSSAEARLDLDTYFDKVRDTAQLGAAGDTYRRSRMSVPQATEGTASGESTEEMMPVSGVWSALPSRLLREET